MIAMLRIFVVAIIVVIPCQKANEYNDGLVMETQFEVLEEYARPGRVSDRFKIFLKGIAISILCALVPSFISVIAFPGTFTTEESVTRSVLFWNVFLASRLVKAGILPICENCEFMSLLDLLFWGFLIGIVGYGMIGVFILALINQWRGKTY